jgi:hypothetical protein
MRMTITEIEQHCEAEYKSLRRAYSGRDSKKLLLNLPFEIESIRQELMKKHDYVKDQPSPLFVKVKKVWGKHFL